MNSIWTSVNSPQTRQNPGTGLDPGGSGANGSLAPASAKAKVPGGMNSATSTTSAAGAAATSGTSAANSAATISSNDFLTLLVTEMQNQDPTAQTDPNEYINQLVQINSLEQLISINQNLATVLGAAAPTTPPASPGAAGSPASAPGAPASAPGAKAVLQGQPGAHGSVAQRGNLSAPHGTASAETVAHSLDGHRAGQAHAAGHALRDIPTH